MKKIISTILSAALMCSSATVIPASAVKDNKGNVHNYIRSAYYGTDDPSDKTTSWSAEVIEKRNVLNGDGMCLATLKCYYNDELVGYDYSKATIAGQYAGHYYDCSVNCWGGWADQSETSRGKGNSTDWIYDNDSHTAWQGCVYYE